MSFATDSKLFIGQVRVEDARTDITTNKPILQYEFVHTFPAVLQRHLTAWFPQQITQPSGAVISVSDYPLTMEPLAGDEHRATTFLIDYAEPAVQQLASAIETAYGKVPSAVELEQFVYDYIVDKNAANGFDIASQVAQSREGDCTEHAVLLTALLRMYGYPARVVVGLYIALDEPVLAYGHAWTEYYSERGWNGLDATRISDSVGRQHVPLSVVENETISYTMGLMKTLQTQSIERIIVTN